MKRGPMQVAVGHERADAKSEWTFVPALDVCHARLRLGNIADPGVTNMDQRLRALVRDLRKMRSSEAADWLMDRYPAGSPDWGEALIILSHLSWKAGDQARLAKHYLSRLPFASAEPYQVFASFMRIRRLVAILQEYVPTDPSRRRLLEYHVGPVLQRSAITPQDREAAAGFIADVRRR